jgi:two-component system nitrate/nitrite response regulator NarL
VNKVIDTLREGVEIVSAQWRYVYVNDVAARIRCRPREKLEGSTLLECLPGFEATPLFGVLKECMSSRTCAAFAERADGPAGAAQDIELRIEPCADGLIIFSRDVNARLAVERELATKPETPLEFLESICLLEDPRTANPPVGELLTRVGYRAGFIAQEPADLMIALARRMPRVAIIDLSHPQRDRLWVLRSLARQFPGITRLVVAPRSQPKAIESFKLLGATEVISSDVISGPALGSVVMKLLERAPDGELTPTAAPQEPAFVAALTPREREVLSHVAAGADNLQVAAALGIAERTVKAHMTSIFRKVGAENRVQLALAAHGMP